MSMKTKAISIVLAALCLSACEGLYTVKDVGEVKDDQMWTIPDMARGLLFQAYDAMPSRPDTYNSNFLDVATDNAVTNSFDSGIHNIATGRYSASGCSISVWADCLDQIQNINLFLEKGLTDKTRYEINKTADAAAKRSLKAEALYLRAWWGARLLQFHGGRTADGQALGYPITDHFITEEEASDYSWIKRNTYEECVEQICADCDSAAKYLPAVATDLYIGRATSLMAEFLKARVLLFAASPAYQPSSIVRIYGPDAFTVLDDDAYRAKWIRAAYQAWKVIQLSGETSYTALKAVDVVDMDANAPVTPSHFVFRYFYKVNNLEARHFPPFYYGSALTTPSQNLVDEYPMKANGYPIKHPTANYDPSNPYAGRDDRLEFTVYHHGSQFGLNDSYIDVSEGGKDSESFTSGSSSGSRTGYYLKKFLSSKKNMLTPTAVSNALHFYPSMRMAEMYLSLAEACNEAWGTGSAGEGITTNAYQIIKDIRAKAGGIVNDQYLEALNGLPMAFRGLILHERRLELAFENFRFWDLRRWLRPLDETVRGVKVTNEGGTVTYTVRDVEKRELSDLKYYYLPVPYNEIMKNPEGMINNIGW